MNCHPEKLYKKKIGEGKHGQVFVGIIGKKQVAIKKSPTNMIWEFKMFKKAYKIAPHNVPKPYKFIKCGKSSIIYSQYIKSKTLQEYQHVTKCMLYKLLLILQKFDKHGIRHNDLHLGNILIEDGTQKPMITDFGLTNVIYPEYDIYEDNDPRFDCHFLLNSIYSFIAKPSPVKTFISSIVPSKYLGRDKKNIFNYRLRRAVPDYPGLPNVHEILKNKYFDTCLKR